jgi:hypothetical protein
MTRRLILKNSSLSGRLSICTGAQCVLSRKLILTFEILTNFASADSSGNGNSFSHSGFRRWWCSDSGNGNRQTGYRNRVGRGLVWGVRYGNLLLTSDGFATAIRDGF